MSYLFETREIGDYRINVYQDEFAGCPCQEYDMVGLYIWQSCDWRDKTISSCCNWRELFGEHGGSNHNTEEALKELVCDYVSQKKICEYIKIYGNDCRLRYDKSDHLWYLEILYDNEWWEEQNFTPNELKDYDYRKELCSVLNEDDFKSLLNDCKDVAFYEWSSSGYCQGDYIEGFAYCDKERFSKMGDSNTTNWRQRVMDLFAAEAKEIGMWMWGDVKMFELEKKVPYKKVFTDSERKPEDNFDWEQIHSCGGYFLDTDELIDNVIHEYDIPQHVA